MHDDVHGSMILCTDVLLLSSSAVVCDEYWQQLLSYLQSSDITMAS